MADRRFETSLTTGLWKLHDIVRGEADGDVRSAQEAIYDALPVLLRIVDELHEQHARHSVTYPLSPEVEVAMAVLADKLAVIVRAGS